MRCSTTWSLLLLLPACEARISGAPIDSGPGPDPTPDASVIVDAADGPVAIDAPGQPPVDAPTVVLGPWTAPIKLGISVDGVNEDDGTLSSNLLELFFAMNSVDGSGKDLFYTSRASVGAAWDLPQRILSTTVSDETPRLSADDKTLYFASARAGNGTLDIYRTTRAEARGTNWSVPEPITEVNTTAQTEKWFMPCANGRYLMAKGPANGNNDIVEGVLGSGLAPQPVSILSSTSDEIGILVAADCLTVTFASGRGGNGLRLYTSTRTSVSVDWLSPQLITDFNDLGGAQEDPWISPDNRTFLFVSNITSSGGGKDLYISTR